MKEKIEKLLAGDSCPEIIAINSTVLAIFNDGEICIVFEVKECDSEQKSMKLGCISDPYIRKVAHYLLAGIYAESQGALDFEDTHIDAIWLK